MVFSTKVVQSDFSEFLQYQLASHHDKNASSEKLGVIRCWPTTEQTAMHFECLLDVVFTLPWKRHVTAFFFN